MNKTMQTPNGHQHRGISREVLSFGLTPKLMDTLIDLMAKLHGVRVKRGKEKD